MVDIGCVYLRSRSSGLRRPECRNAQPFKTPYEVKDACMHLCTRNGGYLGMRYRWVFLTNCQIAPVGNRDPSQCYKLSASTFLTQVTGLPSIRTPEVSLMAKHAVMCVPFTYPRPARVGSIALQMFPAGFSIKACMRGRACRSLIFVPCTRRCNH